jgi:hypothetical protein
MNELKKKAMLDTAALIGGAMLVSTVASLIMIYGPLLPFTAADYGLAFAGLIFVFMVRMTYRMRLEELTRRARLAEKNGVL